MTSHAQLEQMVGNQWLAAVKEDNIRGNANGLRHEDHIRYQDTIIQIRREEFVGIRDLISGGLVTSEEMTTTIIGTEQLNEFRDAIQTMGEITDDNNDTNFTEILTSLPVTHSGWSIQWRQGKGYKSTLGLQESTRTVTKGLENMLFTGTAVFNSGAPVYGYTTHPDRLTDTISDWTDIATNADKVVPETNGLVSRLEIETFSQGSGALKMYISPDISPVMKEQFAAETDRSVKEQILRANESLSDVVVSFQLPAKTVVIVRMRSDTIQLSRAMDVMTVPHMLDKGFLSTRKFTTVAMMVPVFMPDRNNNLALLHANN